MKIYSDFPARRAAQIAADILALVVIALGIWVGVTVSAGIAAIAAIARQVESAGLEFQVAMMDAGDVFGGLPLVGDSARVPFDAAGSAGAGFSSAGQNAAAFITTTAAIVGVVIALVVAALVLWIWLRRRVAFARRATDASRLVRLADGHDLLALRALVHGSRDDLARIARNPVDAWRAGERDVVKRLAALELRGAGVRLAAGAAR
ncbi:hypothetical protein [Leifsonella bigeumensis]